MKNFLAFFTIAFVIFAGTSVLMSRSAASADIQSADGIQLTMRALWEDHITYTRNYIISELAGLPDTDAVSKRLLKNQDDIGAAIKPYYGDDAGNKLASLLKDHILISSKVVKAAKAGNKDQLAARQKEWDQNGNDITEFLNGANPDHWSKSELKDMFQKHLDLTMTEVTSRLEKNWTSDIEAYDQVHAHMFMFADMLADGIVKQFSAKFTQ